MEIRTVRYFLLTWFVLNLTPVSADVGSDTSREISSSTSDTTLTSPLRYKASVVTSVGRNLAPENQTSLSLEPLLTLLPEYGPQWQVYALIDRAFDRYESFSVPKLSLSARQYLFDRARFNVTVLAVATLVELENWSVDGAMWRPSLQAETTWRIFSILTLGGRAGYYRQLSSYATRADGRWTTDQGINERLFASLSLGRTTVESHFLFEQRRTGLWQAFFEVYLRAAYRLADRWTVGIAHQVLTGLVDDATGTFRSVRFYDGRDSRVSAFVLAEL